jgi:hypothetical protein
MIGARRRRRTRRRSLIAGAVVVACLAIVASGAAGEIVRGGDLIVSIKGGISPSTLPKNDLTPVGLSVDGRFSTASGAPLPALRKVDLTFDRHGQINTEGLPTCTVAKLQSTLTAQAKQICKPALVGNGRVTAQIGLPEQVPFAAGGQLLIFNGPPKGGNPVLIFHVHANVPAPTTFITEAMITSKRSGAHLVASIPEIDGGYGRISTFNFLLRRKFTVHGKRLSFISADCPAPGGLPGASFPLVKLTYEFAGHGPIKDALVSRCKVRNH